MMNTAKMENLIERGCSPEEIADMMGVTAAVVRNHTGRRHITPMPAEWRQEWNDVTAQMRPYFRHA